MRHDSLVSEASRRHVGVEGGTTQATSLPGLQVSRPTLRPLPLQHFERPQLVNEPAGGVVLRKVAVRHPPRGTKQGEQNLFITTLRKVCKRTRLPVGFPVRIYSRGRFAPAHMCRLKQGHRWPEKCPCCERGSCRSDDACETLQAHAQEDGHR